MRLIPLLLFAALAAALDVGTLPDPRPGARAIDRSGRAPAAALAHCEAVAAAVRGTGRGELMLVVLGTCGGEPVRDAGRRLFNRWGIGDRGRGDGVLLLVALDDRRVEFLLGTGLDDVGNQARSQAIIDRDILPRLRDQDLDGALRAGVEAAARELFPGGPVPLDGQAQPLAIETPAAPPADRAPPAAAPPATSGIGPLGIAGIAAGGLLGAGGLALAVRRARRRSPRNCPQCRMPMQLLDEAADDAHLDPAQRSEEKVGSVDYDVWVCSGCSFAEKLRYGAWSSSYHRCPQCSAATASDQSTILAQATETATGLVRIDTRCAHCGFTESHTRATPLRGRQAGAGGGQTRGGGGGGSW